jgi:hypothetical protein
LAHRALKAFYPLTSKLDTPAQLAKHERRRRVLRRVAETEHTSYTSERAPVDFSAELKDHHYISKLNRNNPMHIFRFLQQHDADPAVAVGVILRIFHHPYDTSQGFIPKLKDHILYRLRRLEISYCDYTFTDDERNMVIIPDNKIYSVQTMQV